MLCTDWNMRRYRNKIMKNSIPNENRRRRTLKKPCKPYNGLQRQTIQSYPNADASFSCVFSITNDEC